MPKPSGLIRFDSRRRPSMTLGPLWWWVVGLCAITVAGTIPIIQLDPGMPIRRWVGVSLGVAMISYLFFMARSLLRRGRQYKRELAERGLEHLVPAPPDV